MNNPVRCSDGYRNNGFVARVDWDKSVPAECLVSAFPPPQTYDDLWLRFPGVLRIVEPFNPLLEDDDATVVAQPFSLFFGKERSILFFAMACQIAETINGFDVLAVGCRVT